ncbi:hypothetical protein STCU_08474 [Strigomonas culicis]|uniref:Spindle pole body component n=1 Tax=Strigomonas culicis TaxID=28005 RepID=S9TZ02_9TRYP|nr:hypothetical protein STCU_08474 [Strigomonas culicis]|eukprot:EPY21814.1 hypothetical protein STCU_08474 [Strigomonas culicis]
MEELQCCLVGFGSDLFSIDDLLSDDEPSTSAPRPCAAAVALHPTERELLRAVLPLGRAYAYLHEVTQRARMGQRGGGGGLYYAAMAMAVHEHVLAPYRAAVEAAATPTALCAIGDHFRLTLRLLLELFRAPAALQQQLLLPPTASRAAAPPPAEEQREAGKRGGAWAMPVTAIEDVLAHREVPLELRSAVGQQVWLALLHTIAHYVAHGVVLHGREDFFVSVAPPGGGEAEEEVHTLHADRLPRCLSVDFGAFLVATGRERRALLHDAVAPGESYLEALAMGAQDEAASTVYHAVFNPSLCAGGVLQVEELWVRVDAAKALWSKALWARIGTARQLHDRLRALRDIFLCHRGDLWGAFMQMLFARYVRREDAARGAAGGHHYTSEAEVGAAPRHVSSLTRAAMEAYEAACSASGAADMDMYSGFRVVVGAAPASLNEEEGPRASSGGGQGSVEDAALRLVRRVGDIGIQYTVPSGLHHVVSRKALEYYQQLFSFYLLTHLADVALHDARTALSEALTGNPQPSHPLRRTFALHHHCHFLLHNLREYLHVDVKAAAARALSGPLERCGSVEEARRLHDKYLWAITEGSFLVEGAEGPLEACRALCRHAVTLQVLCRRYRVTHWAVEGANPTPVEVSAVLQALESRLHQEVVTPLMCQLQDHGGVGAAARRTAGLWTRIDFNRFYSSSFMRPTQEGVSAPPFAFMVPGGVAAAPPTPRLTVASTRVAAGAPRSSTPTSQQAAAATRARRLSATSTTGRSTALSATTLSAITAAAAAGGRGRGPSAAQGPLGAGVSTRATATLSSVTSPSSTPRVASEPGESPKQHKSSVGSGGGGTRASTGSAQAPAVVRRRTHSSTASRVLRSTQPIQSAHLQQGSQGGHGTPNNLSEKH